MRLLAAVFLIAIALPLAGRAQLFESPLTDEEEVKIDAEEISYDQKTNTILARGKVVINRGDMELRADEVRFNRTTNEADAHGNVTVTGPEGVIFAEAIRMNLDEETGFLGGAEVQSRRLQYSLWGERIEKGLGQSYHIENGRFTTCQCADGPPSWSISGRDLRIDLEGYGRLTRGGTFNVLDVPILYLPRAIFPVQRERQSGFLLPRFGASNRRGFQTLLPFYWAISKSQDATLALDVETSARAGLLGEYRYKFSRDMHGTLSGSYFNESFRGATSTPVNRWSAVVEHDQQLTVGAQAYADTLLVSDDRFLREINTYAFDHSRGVAIRTLPFTLSRVGVVQSWNRVGLKAEGIYYQDLTGPDSQTLQRAPEVDLLAQTGLGAYAVGELAASAVDFQRGSSADGLRIDIEPGATVPLPLGRFAFGALRVSLRETAYHLTEPQVSTTEDLPSDSSRELVQVGADVNTAFSRVYPVGWMGLEKIKHTVEPELTYLYIPAVSQTDLPLFDGTDRVNRRNLITYGLTSRFIGKFSDDVADDNVASDAVATRPLRTASQESSVRELGRLWVQQSVDIARDIDPLQTGRSADHFSDIDVGGRLNPSRALSLRFLTNYDTSNNNLSAARVGVFVQDPRTTSESEGRRLDTRTSAGVSYRVLTQNLLQEIDDNIVLRLTDWAGFLYSSRYDVVTNRFLDNFFGLRLVSTCDCWALDVAVTDRTNPQEIEVRAQLTLVGFGSSKHQRRVAAAP